MAISINGSGITSTEIQDLSIQPTDLAQKMTLMTAQTATGTSIDFTGIPSWANRITVMFNGVSTNGASYYLLQLGSSTIKTSGYNGSSTQVFGSNLSVTTSSTAGIPIFYDGPSVIATGLIIFTNITANTWVASGILGSAATTVQSAGAASLTGVLGRIRITTVNGTDTFDAGSINIMYEG